MLKIGIMGLGKIAVKMVQTAQGMEEVCIHAVGSRSLERGREVCRGVWDWQGVRLI